MSRTFDNISQSSFLSFILYLFYNVDLLKNYDDIRLHTSIIDFVNDVNILTYNDSTKRNCEKLKEIYRKCEKWCETHDSRFDVDKCELIHFNRTSRKHNMQQRIELIECQIDAKTNIKVFEIQLNFKLCWQLHVRQLQIKLIIRTKIIQTLTKFTWEASIKTRRKVYTTIFKSMLSHETSAWYTSTTIKKHRKDVIRKLRFIQNQSLKVATKVYKAIATKTLKIKLHIFSIDLHMKKMMIKIMIRTSRNAVAKTINRIQRNLRNRRERRAKLRKTFATIKKIWLKRQLKKSDIIFI